jgi:membrane protein DedA with SNARE-associated domain
VNAAIVLTEAQGSFGATSLAGLTPVGQAITLGLATFVQEDLPTITAALLAAAGQLSWATAFWGCFLGIWMGDALLYFAARGLGRPLLQFRILQRLAASGSVARSERWFAERGTWLLAGSRFVPGTRLPTYLAAGFLKVPLLRFLGVTGAAVLVWTAFLFFLAWIFGPQLSHFITHHRAGLAMCLFGAFAVLAGFRSLLSHRRDGFRRIAAAYQRWSRWEFWPASLFYLPVWRTTSASDSGTGASPFPQSPIRASTPRD